MSDYLPGKLLMVDEDGNEIAKYTLKKKGRYTMIDLLMW